MDMSKKEISRRGMLLIDGEDNLVPDYWCVPHCHGDHIVLYLYDH